VSREALRSAAEKEVDRWEQAVLDELLRLFDRQEAVVLTRLQGTKARKHTRHWAGGHVPTPEFPQPRPLEVKAILDPARWVKDAAGSLSPLIRRLFGAVYGRVHQGVAGAPAPAGVVDDDRVTEAVEQRLSLIAQGVATAVEEVEAFVQAQEDAGAPMPAIVSGVRELYSGRKPVWAQRIATVNTVGAINQAALFAGFDAGSSAKQWLSRRDDRVRDTHEKADRQVRLLDEPFRLGGFDGHARSLLMFPGDPTAPLDEIINCRCTMLFSPPRKDWLPYDETKRLPKTQTCSEKGCDAQATKRVIWAEGMAYQPCCDAHLAATKHRLEVGQKYGPVDAVRDIKDDSALGELEWKATVRRVRSAAGVRQYGQAINTVIVADPFAQPKTPKPKQAMLDDRRAGSLQVGEVFYDGDDGPYTVAAVRPSRGPGKVVITLDDGSELRLADSAHVYVAGAPRVPSSPPAPTKRKSFGKIQGLDVTLAGREPDVRKLIADHSAPDSPPDPATTEVLALRDHRDRVSGYVVWQIADGPQPKGTVVAVSVHPSMKGQRLGDQMVAFVAQADPDVKVATRPPVGAAPSRGGGSRPASGSSRPARALDANGLPVVADRTKAGDTPGTSGDFDADAARIDRLQKAYMRDGMDTSSLFSRGGRWTAERERQQQAIIDHFLGQPGVKADRKILVIGGLPGAGKTTAINSTDGQQALGIDLAEYVTVNADEVKAEMIARGMVPDYPGLTPDESATLFHAESFEVAHALMRQAARQGKNFAYDTSLKTAGQLGFAQTAALRNAPPAWETTLLFVDVPPAVAKQRARDRYLAGGRYMPLGLIDGMRARGKGTSGPAEQFDAVKRSTDRFVRMENTGAAPTVVETGGKRSRPAAATQPAPRSNAPVTAPARPTAPAAPAPAVPAALPLRAVAPTPLNPNLPPPPQGALVYTHPQGKTIYVHPSGALEVFKPDGKRGTSSATAAKLAAGHGGWSLLAAAPTAPAPTPAAKPGLPAAPPLVAAPTAPLQQSAGLPAPAGALPVTPMDFTEADLSEVPKAIADPDIVFQQKVDGIRGVLVLEPGRKPWFAGKKGERLVSSTAAKTTDPMLAALPATVPSGMPAVRIEGEVLNGKFHVFDMVVVGQESLPYETRQQMAEAWAQNSGLPQAVPLPTAKTAKEKQALWDAVLGSGAEGVMMKRRDAPYDGGQRVQHTRKAKITATADVVVLSVGVGGKANAEMGLRINGQTQSIGTVSTNGKGAINVGDVVEVEYLWAMPTGTLTQPRIVRVRKDKTAADLTDVSQLRVVDKTVLALAGKTYGWELVF
jgi:predicted ABC-type ATPase